ncbi:MAG: acyl-CoA thioesterase [Planctomycetales bacterium]|nr:acyl-CoA thioesterase [Planctomycetales bacterium]
MPAVFEHCLTVPSGAIDGQGHVNNLEYLRWMQDAAVAHSAAQGWPTARYREIGAGWVVRSHKIEYRLPAFAGDRIVLLTWVANFHKIRSLRKYKITRPADGAILAIAETEWAFIGLEHHVPRRVPEELRAAFAIVADEEAP